MRTWAEAEIRTPENTPGKAVHGLINSRHS